MNATPTRPSNTGPPHYYDPEGPENNNNTKVKALKDTQNAKV
jgi:hypothetical protein